MPELGLICMHIWFTALYRKSPQSGLKICVQITEKNSLATPPASRAGSPRNSNLVIYSVGGVVLVYLVVVVVVVVVAVIIVVGGERCANHSNKTTLHCIGLYLKVLRMSAASMLSKASMLSCSTEWRRTFSLMWPSSL